ncbi:MAG TPA: MupA/Atu3671 family FMN-dependent luciferase-like monooxygenase [Thermoanaerobaculia bacterium]|nr:MupA/Atu3671 family FMN-dependent luciferase-like monooxygenase [Thermoanaerobaculia bacterium]
MSDSNRHARLASTLQGIFGRVLRIEPRDIDVEAPFLELGADSLALVEALRGIQEAYGVKLTIRQLFEQLPSISVLAGFLAERVVEAAEPVGEEKEQQERDERDNRDSRDERQDCSNQAPFSQGVGIGSREKGRGEGLGRGAADASAVERLLSQQIQAFNQLVAQQLQALGAAGRPQRPSSPQPPPPAAPASIAKPVLPTHLGKVRAGAEMTERQRAHLDSLIARYTQKTARSKELAEAYRPWLADSRSTVGFRPATKEMLYPLARHRSQGSRLWDVDGNEYVDVTMGMGVHLFGHDPEFLRETIARQVAEGFELGPRSAHSGEVAAFFCELTGMERATFTNSGTEACMTAIRLARARTGRTKIVMFAGSYHGHSDGTLAQTQEIDGELRSFPVAPGVPPKVAEDVLVLAYGTPHSLEVIRKHRHELAAVFVEPIQSRHPEIQPRDFLHELRRLTAESGIALIFDEMICGFRLHLGGAQAHFGVRADLATYGKVVGGGFPIGVVAGSADFMDGIDGGMWRYGDGSRPERETTFFGGTFCQHPLAMAAAKRVLTYLKDEGPALQETLNARTTRFAERLNEVFETAKAPLRTVSAHSLFRFQSAANIDLLYYHLVDKGVYVWEWRNCFLSTAHTDADLDFVVRAVGESVAELQQGGFLPEPPGGPGGGGGRPETALGFWGRQEGKPAIAPVVVDRTDRTDPSDKKEEHASREVRFGLYFFGNYAAEFASSKYELIFDCARFADRHGFASLWFPERHFHPFGGLSPNPSVLGAALARETERIALRAGSVVLPLHHPVRVAEEWSLVDNLSGGRVGLSCASGWHPNDFALAPESYGPHRELTFERLETVRKLWRGEAVRLRDGAGSEVDLRIFPLPARRDLPVWLTIVNNPDTYRQAGEIGAGVLTNLMGQTVETLAASILVYREALAAAGHPPEAGHVAVLLHTFVGSEAAAAVETARCPFYRYLESSVGLLKTMIASEGLAVDLEHVSPEDLEYMLGLAYQRYVSTSALIGSPESCAPIVERMREIGVDEIACLVDFGVDREAVTASLPWLDALRQKGAARAPFRKSEPIDVPLTETQEDLYTIVQLGEEASVAYNEPGTLGIHGPLDLALLRKALQQVVDRHEALRTVLPPPGPASDPIQRILPGLILTVPLVDVAGLPPERREVAAAAWAEAEGRRPFDFACGPLIRASVLRLAPREHRLFLSVHHLMADGLSVVVILKDMLAIYEAERAGRAAALPAPMRLREYVAWTRRERDFTEDEAWWLEVFAGAAGTLPIFEPPTDRPRPPERTFRGAGAVAELPPELRRAIHQLGRRRGATFFITLLTAWSALLHRWTGQDDVVIGMPSARRPLEGGDRLVGHCVDLVPMRSQVGDGDVTFAAHLAAVRNRVFGAHDHGEYPFARLVRALKLPRDRSRWPLVNVIFNLDQNLGITRAGGLEIAGRSSGVHGVKLDLAVHALELGEGVRLDLEYRTDLFDAATVHRLLGHFRTLLEGAVADPDAPLWELPLLTPAEERQVVAAWNETAAEIPRATPVHRLFAAVTARDSQAPAVLWEGGALSYGDLDRWANRLARRLRSRGVGPEVAVVLDLPRSAELVVAMLAVLKAGGFYVPLDPADPEERRALILEDSGALVRLGGADVIAAAEAEDVEDAESPVDAGNLAYVIYTSGSTGRPKGVAIPHRAIVRLAVNTAYLRLGPGDRVAHASNTAFDAATFEVWSSLLAGAALVVIPREVVLSPAALGAEYGRLGITAAFLTTALFNEVVREAPGSLAGVRHLLTGGEAVSPRHMREARSAMPGQRLLHVYGPTESTTFATWHPVESVPEDAVSVPIGLPLANTRIHLADRHLRPVPLGVPGELLIAGEGLARGYHRRPDLTAERFIPDPFDPAGGGRLYRTGDLARRRPDGAVEFLGRTDPQVKVRGFRIEPGEIEAVLARAPGVRECAVLAREDKEGRRLIAWVVMESGIEPDLRAFLRQRLPEAMVPAAFGVLESFPRTASGKVDRRALAALEPAGAGSEVPFEPPRTPVEEIVAGAWTQVLGVARVGRHDDFFDLGGHSLLASRVLSRLRGPLGAELPLRDFFREPTVAGIARMIEQAREERRGAVPPPLVHVPWAGRPRLSFAQERLWLVDQLQPESTGYNMDLPLVLTGRLDVAALTQALAEIARRHEVLRTRFESTEGGPVQVVEPVSWLGLDPLPQVDLTTVSTDAAQAELRRLAGERRPFDLARGPLLRAVLVRLAAEEHALLAQVHHAVCDGWSLDVMTRELSTLYGAFAQGRPSPLPDLPIQYADFARWQRQWLQGEVVEGQLAWWRERLGENPAPLALPTDRPRPPVLPAAGSRGETRGLLLPPELAGRLVALARQRGATLFITLLAGFEALLHRHTHQERIAMGSPVAGRTRLEVEELIGHFVNTLMLAADFGGEPSGGELVERVRDSTLGAFDHQDLPFEQLVAALARDRDPSRQPLFQAMFALQNNAGSEAELQGLAFTTLPSHGGPALFDLTLGAAEVEGGGIACGITYAADLFDPPTIVRLLEQYRRLLEGLVEDPGLPVSGLPLLSAAERHQVEVEHAFGPLTETAATSPGTPGAAGAENAAAIEEARRAELERRRTEVASRRGQLSADRRALLRQWVGGKAAAPPASQAVTPLVELQTAGSRPPLFIVHAAGGLVHDYVNLAQRLDPDQPLYGLQSPALAGGEHFATVLEMAACYVEAVRSVQPRGPYRLGGYCVGGAVAFEMARQLRAAGEEAESLLLFDSPAPFPEPPALDEAEMLASFVRSHGHGVEVSADELRSLPPEAWIGEVLRRLDPALASGELHLRWEVMKRNTRAIFSYVPPGRLPLGAVLFRAAEQTEEHRDQPFMGWERWLEGPIEVVDVPGGHLGVFQEPAVEAVAHGLRARTMAGAAI